MVDLGSVNTIAATRGVFFPAACDNKPSTVRRFLYNIPNDFTVFLEICVLG